MKEQKYHLYLSDEEYRRVLQSLFSLKNSLIAQGRYTDAVDDVLCKVLSSKKRKINRHSPYLSITLPKYYQYYL